LKIMKHSLLIPLLLLFVGAYDAKAQQAPFSLVVLTNVAKEPQAAWETWNSWGYQAIRFEVTTPDGRKTVVSPRMQDFTRNFPSTFLVQPGEHCVYPIALDEWWEAIRACARRTRCPLS
jgi:hypothetical protein